MAGNMTLLAFAAVTAFCWARAVQQLIDISCLPGPQQQTRSHAAATVDSWI